MKKTPEQKLIGQIERLSAKQADDTELMSGLVLNAEQISQKTDPKIRKQYHEMVAVVDEISKSFERRKRLLRRKGEKLSELQTKELISESLS